MINLDLLNDEYLFERLTEPIELDEFAEWTEEEIEHLFDCLLQDSLRNLVNPKSSPSTCAEIHAWMMNADDPTPFSFENCCAITGVDADAIRSLIQRKINSI